MPLRLPAASWIAPEATRHQHRVVRRLERRDPGTDEAPRRSMSLKKRSSIAGDGDRWIWVRVAATAASPRRRCRDRRPHRFRRVHKTLRDAVFVPDRAGNAGVWLWAAALCAAPVERRRSRDRRPSRSRARDYARWRRLAAPLGLSDGSAASIRRRTASKGFETAGAPSTGPVTAMVAAPVRRWLRPAIDGVTSTPTAGRSRVRQERSLNEFLTVPFIPTAVADAGGLCWCSAVTGCDPAGRTARCRPSWRTTSGGRASTRCPTVPRPSYWDSATRSSSAIGSGLSTTTGLAGTDRRSSWSRRPSSRGLATAARVSQACRRLRGRRGGCGARRGGRRRPRGAPRCARRRRGASRR